MAFNVGDTAGDYQVIGILGTGGMGQVYKVRNVISDRVEAMKVLLPDLEKEPEVADRFMREIKLVASLSHPNIAGLHTALRLENQLLMIMEFVEGRTLEDRLKDGPVPAAEAAGYAIQALAALAYAHQRGVIHRDIKPANMIVTPSGVLKLMDFGIARAVSDRRLTMTGATLGSLYYMSPEQVKGGANLDGRSDLYSMGVSLYEMVTGTRPFKGDSDYSIMAAHLEQQPVPPVQIDPALPPRLNQIILTAIQKDPNVRFQTAQAFQTALESCGRQPAAPPPMPVAAPVPAPVAAPPPPAGHRGLWMALGALAVLAVLAVAALQVPRFLKTRAGTQTAPAVETATPPQQQPPAAEPAAAPPAAQETPGPAAPAPAAQEQPAPPRAKSAPPRRVSTPPAEPAPAAPAPVVAEQAPPPPASAKPAVDTAALEELRDRLGVLGPRAGALRDTLQTLLQQQRAMGLGLRRDVAFSWRRMETALDEGEAALKAENPERARRALDAAEREADKLDKFLGH